MTLRIRPTIPAVLLVTIAAGSYRLEANPLEEFVCRNYDTGAVPFEKARNLVSAPGHVKALQGILNDDGKRHCWYNAAMAMGAEGSLESVQFLEEFVLKGSGKLKPEEYDGKGGAILALGWAANSTGRKNTQGSNEAFRYLKTAIDFHQAPWAKLGWISPFHADGSSLRKDLTGRAIEALGLSGRNEAHDLLEQSVYCRDEFVLTNGTTKEKNILQSTCKAALELIPRAKAGLGKMYP